MTDVFFSYSSKDRERVRPIRDALVAEGFDVFWDQEVPPGRNWDEWIRQHLDAARCAVVFWSEHSVKSDNVVHEATIAKNFGKLIPVLLDPIDANQFPMGHYTTQGIAVPPEGMAPATLQRLSAEVETKAMRRWMRRRMAELEGRVKSLTAIREQLEDNETALTRRVKELETQADNCRREKATLSAQIRELKARADASEPMEPTQTDYLSIEQAVPLATAHNKGETQTTSNDTKLIIWFNALPLSVLLAAGSVFPFGIALRWDADDRTFAVTGLVMGLVICLIVFVVSILRRNALSLGLVLFFLVFFAVVLASEPSWGHRSGVWYVFAAGMLAIIILLRRMIDARNFGFIKRTP